MINARQENARKLRIWMFNAYGPLPDEGWREYSYTMLGKALAAAGHEVVWWTSNFSHHFKKFRSADWTDKEICDGFTVRLVPTPGYRRNISPARFWRDAVYSWRSYRKGSEMPPPDVILTSESPLTFGYAAVPLARNSGAALVYDQMDLWPELIVQAFPARMRAIANFLLLPVYARRKAVFNQLDGAMALARPYLDSVTREWSKADQRPTLLVYNGIDVAEFRKSMQHNLPDELVQLLGDTRTKAIFAGSLGPSYDVGPMVEAARLLAAEDRDMIILIAGDGPARTEVEDASRDCSNLFYLGKLAPSLLPAVYARCDIGLLCYSATSNVEMPDKFYDYSAAGLAMVNSLNGEVRHWIDDHQLGVQYRPGDGNALAAQLLALSGDSSRLQQMGRNSWEVGQFFDCNGQLAEFVTFVERVAQRKRAAG